LPCPACIRFVVLVIENPRCPKERVAQLVRIHHVESSSILDLSDGRQGKHVAMITMELTDSWRRVIRLAGSYANLVYAKFLY
jgi:hypothetical protein